MNIIKESVVFDRKIGREVSQLLLEGDIIVPDIKPDMDIILQTSAESIIDNKDIVNERINFKGKLNINILYIAKGEGKPIHSMSFSAPINDFISMDGIDKDMTASMHSDITNIDYKIINDRKISYRAVIEVAAKVMSTEECSTVIGIEDLNENQIKRKSIRVEKNVSNKEDHFIIKDEINIPSGKSNIRDVLQCDASIFNKDFKVADGKVNINGDMLISVLYKGDSDEDLIEFVEQEIPFNGSIEIDGAKDGMLSDVNISVQEKFFQVRPDGDGEDRVLEVELSVGAAVNVCCEQDIPIIEDAYCINKVLNMEKNNVIYPYLVCKNKNQCPVKEVIKLDSSAPKVLQVFKVNGKAHLDDVKIIDDKVIAEGIINTDILYIAESDDVPLYSYSAIIPYKQVIEAKGARNEKNMTVNIEAEVEHAGFNMLSDNEIEFRCMLNFDTSVIEEKEAGLITDIKFEDILKDIIDSAPSVIIYVVQPGDTLWCIAKRFNTSIDDIVMLNDIENPDKIYPGQKLLILKKIVDCD